MNKKLSFLALVVMLVGYQMMPGRASSHREAPLISNDPQADHTDVYAFVSPDAPDTVTLIASFIPFEDPAGGPNFFRFGDNVLYELKVDNNADGVEDITYQFRFTSQITNPNTFLYNTGPIKSLDDPNRNLFQTYTVTRIDSGRTVLTVGPMRTMYDNVGPASTPNYGGNGSGIYEFNQPDGTKGRVQVFLTGVPGLNQPSGVKASEMIRLNTDIRPVASPARMGVLAGDTAGFPNGRRLTDDVLDITVQAAAGFLTGARVSTLGDGVDRNDVAFRTSFPYLAFPHSGGNPWKLNPRPAGN